MASLRAKIDGSSEPKEAVGLAKSEAIPPAPEAIASPSPMAPPAKDPLTKDSQPKDSQSQDSLANDSLAPSGSSVILFAATLAIFWSGAAFAFLWGYYGIQGLVALPPHSTLR